MIPSTSSSSPCSSLPNEVLEQIFYWIEPYELGIAVQVCKVWHSCCQNRLNSYRSAQLNLRKWLYTEVACLFGNDAEEKKAFEISEKKFDLSTLKIEPLADPVDNSLCRLAFDFVANALDSFFFSDDDTQICSFIDRKVQRLIPPHSVLILDLPLESPLDPYTSSAISFLPQNFILFPSSNFEKQVDMLDPESVQRIFFSKRILQYAPSQRVFLEALQKCKKITSLSVLTTHNQSYSEKSFSKLRGKTRISTFQTLFSTLVQLPNLLNINADNVNFSDNDAEGLARYIQKGNERSKAVYCSISGQNHITDSGCKRIAKALYNTERGFALSINNIKSSTLNRNGIKVLKQIPTRKRNVVVEIIDA